MAESKELLVPNKETWLAMSELEAGQVLEMDDVDDFFERVQN